MFNKDEFVNFPTRVETGFFIIIIIYNLYTAKVHAIVQSRAGVVHLNLRSQFVLYWVNKADIQ